MLAGESLHGSGLGTASTLQAVSVFDQKALLHVGHGCMRRVDAGKVELDGAQYLGFNLPFSISQLLWIEALLVGGAEIYRNSSTNLEERIYPGQ